MKATSRTMAVLLMAGVSIGAAETDLRLIQAARGGDVAALESLLEAGADPATRQGDGSTALHWAAFRDSIESADALLRAGADPNAANDLGATPLWLAGINGGSLMVSRLLDAGANPNAVLATAESVLMVAARTGNVAVVKLLLGAGANPDVRAVRGQTALMWAVAQRHPAVVEALLAAGAKVDVRTDVWTELVKTDTDQASHPDYQITVRKGGNSALMFAAQTGDRQSAALLLTAGAAVNDRAASGTSALVVAAHSNHEDVVSLLLEHGADPNTRDAGYTALHAAVLRGNEKMATALLARGGDPNARVTAPTPTRRETVDYFLHNAFVGATPLWLAARFSMPGLMRLLAEHGADASFVSDVAYPTGAYGTYGRVIEGPTTILMAAVGMGGTVTEGWELPRPGQREALALECVKVATELGVPLNAANASGDTALHGATARRLEAVGEYLVKAGADVRLVNKAGRSPLEPPPPRTRPR